MPEIVFFDDARGQEPVRAYLEDLVRHGERTPVATFARYVDLLEEKGASLPMPIARMIDRRSRIYELRVGAHRFAYAEREGQVIPLHGWRKQSQKLDRREVNIARGRLSDWQERL